MCIVMCLIALTVHARPVTYSAQMCHMTCTWYEPLSGDF